MLMVLVVPPTLSVFTAALGEPLNVGTVRVESLMLKLSMRTEGVPMVFVNAFMINVPGEDGPGLMLMLAEPDELALEILPLMRARPPLIVSVPTAAEAPAER